jgi:uncharacterized protein YpmS
MIKYKSNQDSDDEYFIEIIYNNNTVYSRNDDTKYVFLISLVISILILSWLIFIFVKTWKNSSITVKEKSKNDEEIFFDNWGVRKKNEKCTLTYISKMDGDVKHIKICTDDYLAAKNGKMTLNGFDEKYNLW